MTVSQMMKNTSRASYPDFPQQLSDNVQSRDPRRRGERGPRQAFTWETDTQLSDNENRRAARMTDLHSIKQLVKENIHK